MVSFVPRSRSAAPVTRATAAAASLHIPRSELDESFEENCWRNYQRPDLAPAMEALHISAKTRGSSTARPFGKGDGSGSDSSSSSSSSDASDSDDSLSDEESRSALPPVDAAHCHSAALALDAQRPSRVVIPPNSIDIAARRTSHSAIRSRSVSPC